MATFKSTIKNLTIYVTINDKHVEVGFRSTNPSQTCGYFDTRDKDIIKAIKNHPDYGTWFTVEEDDYEDEVEEVDPVEKKSYDSVKRTQEAIKVLVSEYGVNKDSLRSKEDALRFADGLNIVFPNLK